MRQEKRYIFCSKGRKYYDGEWLEDSRLDDRIVNYFHTLFLTNTMQGSMDFLSVMGSRVSEGMSSELTRVYSVEEVNIALKLMPSLFYQPFWHIVGSSVTKAILHYLNSCQIPSELNHTFITLIFKKK